MKLDKKCCNRCDHLNVINNENTYAVCMKNKWIFAQFEADTRETVCSFFKKKGDGND